LAAAARTFRPSYRRDRAKFLGLSPPEIFRKIYRENIWQSEGTRSGMGSTLTATAPIRQALTEALVSVGARTLLDIPCGDFFWMRHVDLSCLDLYIGSDIVPELVARLEEECGAPGREFRCLDLCADPLPKVDVVLCRDVFLHLEQRLIAKAVNNVIGSGARYLFASSYPDVVRNVDIPTGLSRPVNLTIPPFTLPAPDMVIEDPGVHSDRRILGVWELQHLRQIPVPK